MEADLRQRIGSIGFWLAFLVVIAAFVMAVMGQLAWPMATMLIALGLSRLL